MTKHLLFFTVLLSPIYIVRHKICCVPFIGEYSVTLLEILISLTFGSYLAEKVRRRNFQFSIFNFQLCVAIGLFLLAAVISVFVSPDKKGALGILKAYFIEPIVIWFIITDTVKERKDGFFLLKALLLSGFWISLLAIIQGFTGKFSFASHEMAQDRAHGVYNTANAVGLYVGPIFALSLGLFMEQILRKLKTQGAKVKTTPNNLLRKLTGQASQNLKLIIFFTLSILYVLAIIFSKSSGALLGILVVVLLLIVAFSISLSPSLFISKLIRRSGNKILIFILFSGLLAWLWFFYNISNFTPRVQNIYERPGGSEQVRLCLWEGTKNLISDRPIFGAGLSGFKEVYSRYYLTCDAEALEYPHNIFLNFWTELGILGVISFALIIFLYLKNLMAKGTLLAKAFMAAMLYWLVHGLVDVPYFKNDLALEFWVIVALSIIHL